MGVIMLPPNLIEQFWQKVQVLLESDHCLKRDRSREALSRYRKLVEAKVGGQGCCRNNRGGSQSWALVAI